ncbi:MAG: DUF4393 domain-containing protein [Magnetococcus sp. YQC-3]
MGDSGVVDAALTVAKAQGTEVYQDAIKPWLKPLGHVAGVLVRAVVVALHSLEGWVADKEAARDRMLSAVAWKVEGIPPDDLVLPRPAVAQPAIEGMAQNLGESESELFDQFANLLANSMSRRHADRVHPGFAATLKQMTSSEAELARWFFLNSQQSGDRRTPCIRLQAAHVENETLFEHVLSYYLGEGPYEIFNRDGSIIAASLNNFERLGLFCAPIFPADKPRGGYLLLESGHLAKDAAKFHALREEKTIQDLSNKVERDTFLRNAEIREGYAILSDFGILFLQACLIPPSTPAEQHIQAPS